MLVSVATKTEHVDDLPEDELDDQVALDSNSECNSGSGSCFELVGDKSAGSSS